MILSLPRPGAWCLAAACLSLTRLGLFGCHRDEPTLRTDSGGSTVLPPPARVIGVVDEGAPGSLFAAKLVDPTDEPAVFLGEQELESAWEPDPDDAQRLWRIPAAAPVGPATVEFRFADGVVEPRPLELREAWFESVGPAVGVVGDQVTDGWSDACAQSLTGIGVADVDLDGDFDLLRGHLTAPAQLFLNLGDPDGDGLPNFEDRTAELGLGGLDFVVSVNFADIDNDRDPDLFLGRRGENRLLVNQLEDGTPGFLDITPSSGLVHAEQRTTGGGWGDYDGDGDLDLYEVNHTWCYPGLDTAPANGDHLYRNDHGHFIDVSHQLDDMLGQVSDRYGFAALWFDAERDGDQDLWVVNDAVEGGGRSVLWRNDGYDALTGSWQFLDATLLTGAAPLHDSLGKTANAMGGAIGDVNGDGFADLAYSNIGPNALHLSDGGGGWVDVSTEREVDRTTLPWGETSVTWGTHLFDVDLDGDLDLLYVGGSLKGSDPQPHALLENPGDGGDFVDRTWGSGLATTGHGGSSIHIDLDGDGFLDVLVSNWDGPVDVFRNRLGDREPRHWLAVDARGDGVRVNRDGFGAIVELERADGEVATCFRTPSPSMSATGDPACWFGLGPDDAIESLRVIWPDGVEQAVDVGAVDRRIAVVRAP